MERVAADQHADRGVPNDDVPNDDVPNDDVPYDADRDDALLPVQSDLDRAALAEAGQARAAELTRSGVVLVALTWVDNAGVTRVKAVPVDRFGHAVAWGVGMSTVHDVFQVDDTITTSRYIGGPVGDLRLHPDAGATVVLAAQPGWAWAPVDRWAQDGRPYPADQRGFVRRVVDDGVRAGFSVQMGFELEWYLANPDGSPATTGPAYGMARLMEVADYGRDLVAALSAQDVPIEQYHPEYSSAQFELSIGAADPVTAADRVVLARETVRAMSLRYGMRSSFAPVPVAGHVGNGMHLHLSVGDAAGRNVFAGGSGPHGLTGTGESCLAALLDRLPAIAAVGAPGVGSHLRLVPRRWAGAYQCWGVENREAALRFIPGVAGTGQSAANVELKCVDGSANPYLAAGVAALVAIRGADAGLRLPPGIDVDPEELPPGRRPARLPETVAGSLEALAADDLIGPALGVELLDAFRAVHLADAEAASGCSAEEIAGSARWRY